MKMIASLLAIVVVLSVRADAQKSAPSERVSLDIGSITVWLGEAKPEVIKKFADAGFETSDLGDKLLAYTKTEAHDIQFKNGRLEYADVEWYHSGKIEPLDAAVEALGVLADKSKPGVCIVTHEPMATPEAHLDRIFISCGKRSLLIAEGTLQNSPTLTVSERIGNIETDSQH